MQFQPIDLPFTIRQTSLETSRCLFRFHKHHVLHVPEPESEVAIRGTDFHELARQYVNYLVPSQQEMDWTYADQLAAGDWDPDAVAIFKDWSHRRSITPSAVFATEYQIRLGWDLRPCDDATAVFRSDLDRVDIVDREADIWDYKTHFAAFEPTTVQAIFYPWMLWKVMPHLEVIRFNLDFVRYGIERTREFTRESLERMDRYVENQVGRLVDAYRTDEWPASVNSKCVYCRLDCPLIEQGMSWQSVGQIKSSDQAEALAQQLFALRRTAAQIFQTLRTYAIENGEIEVGNDIRLGFIKQPKIEYDARSAIALNREHGFSEHRALRVASSEVKKIARDYPEYASRLKERSRDRSTTKFQFWNDKGDPIEMEDENVND